MTRIAHTGLGVLGPFVPAARTLLSPGAATASTLLSRDHLPPWIHARSHLPLNQDPPHVVLLPAADSSEALEVGPTLLARYGHRSFERTRPRSLGAEKLPRAQCQHQTRPCLSRNP